MKAAQYLQDAIEFSQNYGNAPFLVETLMLAVDRALQEGEIANQLPSGESVLVALSRVSTEAALYWAEKRGPSAWLPTETTLISLMELPNFHWQGSNAPLVWTRDFARRHEKDNRLLDLIEQGIVNAMPLTASAASTPPKSAAEKSRYKAQAIFLKSLFALSSTYMGDEIKRLWSAFKKSNGALVFTADLFGAQMEGVSICKPQTQVWFNDGSGVKRATWLEHWRACGESRVVDDGTLAWLRKNQVDVSVEENTLFIERLENLFNKDMSAEKTWDLALERFNRHPGAWEMETQNAKQAKIFWHTLFNIKPATLGAALKNPPPPGFEQRSSSGKGIWDVISSQGPRMSSKSLRALNAKVKLTLSDYLDFREEWTEDGVNWARQNMKKNPAGWVGEPSEKQDAWAASMLAYACSSNKKYKASALNTYALLMETPEARASLGDAANGVLWVMGCMQHQGFFKGLNLCAGLSANPPGDEGLGAQWCASIAHHLSVQSEKVDPAPAALGVAHALLEERILQLGTPSAKPSVRSRRF